MKVRCINTNNANPMITIGNTYEIIKEDNRNAYYLIKDNENKTQWYKKYRFEIAEGDGSVDLTIEQKVESLENQIKELKEELHKREQQKVWWTPKSGDKYFYVSSLGDVLSDYWVSTTGCNRRILGNCFRTKEEAEREVFERELRFKLKKFAYENNEEEIDWNNSNQRKYSIYYRTKSNELDWDYNFTGNHYGIIHFTSQEIVKKAMETFKDDLIRYFTCDK